MKNKKEILERLMKMVFKNVKKISKYLKNLKNSFKFKNTTILLKEVCYAGRKSSF